MWTRSSGGLSAFTRTSFRSSSRPGTRGISLDSGLDSWVWNLLWEDAFPKVNEIDYTDGSWRGGTKSKIEALEWAAFSTFSSQSGFRSSREDTMSLSRCI